MVDRIKMFSTDFNGKILVDNLTHKKKDIWSRVHYKLKSPRSGNKETIYLNVVIGETKFGQKKVTINGNLRKWYFGLNNFGDLDYFQYEKCIEKISLLVFGNKQKLWEFRVSNIELGFTIKEKLLYSDISNAYVSYQNFRKIWYENESSTFVGSDYVVTVYNKGFEVLKSRKTKSGASKKMAYPIEKLISKKSFIRYEIKIKDLANVVNFKELCNTPGKVLYNWDEVLNKVHETINKITYVNYLDASFENEIGNKKIKETSAYFIYIGMQTIGITRTMSILEKANVKDIKRLKQKFAEISLQFDKPRHLIKKDLKKTISRRVRKLKANYK